MLGHLGGEVPFDLLQITIARTDGKFGSYPTDS